MSFSFRVVSLSLDLECLDNLEEGLSSDVLTMGEVARLLLLLKGERVGITINHLYLIPMYTPIIIPIFTPPLLSTSRFLCLISTADKQVS